MDTDPNLDYQIQRFWEGAADNAYSLMGSHPVEGGWRFRVWAPNARLVCVMGDFNGWNDSSHPLSLVRPGIWECVVPGLKADDNYKYAIHTQDGRVLAKADPYAFYAEVRPGTASRLCDLSGYVWGDANWLAQRKKFRFWESPLNIYEVHLGSWRRTGEGEFLSYRDIAQWMVPYVKEMGYTHVELMPVTEHPLDMSWGYQVTGYFAATSRFGRPHDLMYLIDQLHQAGVGVLMDWVPAHFPKDAFGLYEFDGQPCYEYADLRKGEQPGWGTRIFDFGRSEVRSFLTASAMFWLREYHVDGLRVDAVSSMLYLDFGKQEGQWSPNVNGGRENLEAISFLRHLNGMLHGRCPDILTIAEESTEWAHVTGPLEASPTALGFDLKWNMGWMNDALHYQKMDGIYRQFHHRDLNFSLMYAFHENFILPISHDEVVHMKGSMLGKMPGADDAAKFAGVRAFFVYMMTHPGKKLTIMGTELGQFNEWHYEQSLDWHLLEYPAFQKHHHFFQELNQFYLEHAELWQMDNTWAGFQWVCADDAPGNTIIYLRRDRAENSLLTAVNFSPIHRKDYRMGVPVAGGYTVVFNSDDEDFGGGGRGNHDEIFTQPIACHGYTQSLLVDLPPLSGVILKCTSPAPDEVPEGEVPSSGKQPEKISGPEMTDAPAALGKSSIPAKSRQAPRQKPKQN